VVVIDLDKLSREMYEKLGPENAKYLFMELDSAEHPNYPAGVHDNTHFNEYGARKMAEIVLSEMKVQHLDLANRIVKGENQSVVNPQAR
jgi:lysophospholipase L1-like esterase